MSERRQINGIRSNGGDIYAIALLLIALMCAAAAVGVFNSTRPAKAVTIEIDT